jgi:beta-ketoacyl synthase-like protein
MTAPVLSAGIAGIGFWARGLPSWQAACAYLTGDALPADAPSRPSPQLLAPNERRRAPETVAVALEVALAACIAAGRDPATLSSVFASTHGDLNITDYMCETLAGEPRSISPTRFHNSVHNAAAGYWTIGAGAMAPATALSAYDASFAQGLLEALAQLATGTEAVLLVACDGHATGPVARVSRSQGLLGAALLLVRDPTPGMPRLQVHMKEEPTSPTSPDGPLSLFLASNAMAPMLPLFEALALRRAHSMIGAGHGTTLRIDIIHD